MRRCLFGVLWVFLVADMTACVYDGRVGLTLGGGDADKVTGRPDGHMRPDAAPDARSDEPADARLDAELAVDCCVENAVDAIHEVGDDSSDAGDAIPSDQWISPDATVDAAPDASQCLAPDCCGVVEGPGRDVCGPQADANRFAEVEGFGPNTAGLKMYRYAPASLEANAGIDAPLVVFLHGCFGTATSAQNGGWNDLAEHYGFYMVYPEQQMARNPSQCFNWMQLSVPAGLGDARSDENASIVDMITYMTTHFHIDSARVFIAGFGTGGGSQTASIVTEYPALFDAAAIINGMPYGCGPYAHWSAGSMPPGTIPPRLCPMPDDVRRPENLRNVVLDFNRNRPEHWPRMSLWQSAVDPVLLDDARLEPRFQEDLITQWTGVLGVDRDPDECERVDGHLRQAYHDEAGSTLVESYSIEIQGAGAQNAHAVPVDIEAGCGREDIGTYHVDAGISFAYHVVRFFGITDNR